MSTPTRPKRPRRKKINLDDLAGSARDICARHNFDPMQELVGQCIDKVWDDKEQKWIPYLIASAAEEEKTRRWDIYMRTLLGLNEFLRGKKRQTETKEQHDYNIKIVLESPNGEAGQLIDVTPPEIKSKNIEALAKDSDED